MRAALYRRDGHIRVEEIERPEPATGGVRAPSSRAVELPAHTGADLGAGGAGAVGDAAVELGRRGGADLIATASDGRKRTLSGQAGAAEVVDYRQPGAADRIRASAPADVDRTVEALRAAVTGVSDALRDSAPTCLPLTRFPLQNAAAAQDAVRGGTLGKVLIDV